jgi:pimeloyl-ACP methyl ester carboxylesterase
MRNAHHDNEHAYILCSCCDWSCCLAACNQRHGRNVAPAKARNVVLVHGLFADGSCWSEVITRLQAAGLNATAVQNPLTTLTEAFASAQRVLDRQDGPTVFVGHSFSGMIASGGQGRP